MRIFLALPILEIFPPDLQEAVTNVTDAYVKSDAVVINYYNDPEVIEWIKDRKTNHTKILLRAYELLLTCDMVYLFKMADYGIYSEVGDFRNMALNRDLDIENEIKDERRPKYIFNHLIRVICKYYGVHPDYIRQHIRHRRIVEKRGMLYLFCREYTDLSSSDIGYYCSMPGSKKHFNHATVLHGVKTIKNLIDTDKQIRYDYNMIRAALMNSRYIFNTREEEEEGSNILKKPIK